MKMAALFLPLALVLAPMTYAQQGPGPQKLSQGVPDSAYLAVQAWQNSEREFQNEHLKRIWKTIEQEDLGARFLKIITSRLSEKELADAKSILEEIHNAVVLEDYETIAGCEEFVYAQVMEFPTTNHLFLMRYPESTAQQIQKTFANLLGLIEKYSQGEVTLHTATEDDAEIVQLRLPAEVPFQPMLIRVDGVVICSTSEVLARTSYAMLFNGVGESKFEDPRLKHALEVLPEPEDALVFFDGRQLFKQLHSVESFIQQQSQNDPDATRVARIMKLVLNELKISDYEVTVEYTEDHLLRSEAFGKVLPDAEEKLLGKMVLGGEPFENWQSWIPADAIAYSLHTGVRLHPAYERTMEILNEEFPETKEGLQKFEEFQTKIGVHLDRDILQSFSGETVSVRLPKEGQGNDSVCAVRCENPERIRELLHRLVNKLSEIPALEAQQIQLQPSGSLDGFEELQAATLTMFQVQPVIGFRDEWMMVGSSEAAIQQVLDARAGEIETINTDEDFQKFDLNINGPVLSLYYRNLADSIHQAADVVRQIGAMAPMIIGMAGANANQEELQPVMELAALLPSVANVVEKFDYLQSSLTVTQPGPEEHSYVKRSATLVRPVGQAEEGEPEELEVRARAAELPLATN